MESEKILKDVATVRNITDSRGELVQRATRYLRFRERRERKEELDRIDGQLKQPAWVNAGLTAAGRAALAQRRRELEKELNIQSPPELSPAERDALWRRGKELEERIRADMPTHEEMRRNPVGAVDKNRKWMKNHADEVMEWKNIQIARDPQSDEQDLANIERIRPSMLLPHESATFMANAQIPGHFAQSLAAKANWPLGEPKVDTPLAQAERREIAEEMVQKGVAEPSEVEQLKETIWKLQQELNKGSALKEKRRAHIALAREKLRIKREVERKERQAATRAGVK